MTDPHSSDPLLEVKDLSVTFAQGKDGPLAVDHISFSLKRGRTLALVGESGSGKSITALSITRLLAATAARHPSGEIHFAGRNLLQLDEAELQKIRGKAITMVFQEPMTSLNLMSQPRRLM